MSTISKQYIRKNIVASLRGLVFLPEVRSPYIHLSVGLPSGTDHVELTHRGYRTMSRMEGYGDSPGSLISCQEYGLQDCYENLIPGDRVILDNRELVVSEKNSILKDSLVVHDYVLRPAGSFRAVTGQIMKESQEEAEQVRKQEEARKKRKAERRRLSGQREGMAGSFGSWEETLDGDDSAQPLQADAGSMPGYKDWSTKGRRGISLSRGGVRFYNGDGKVLNLAPGGAILKSRGGMELVGENPVGMPMLCGKEVHLKAREYIYLSCGTSQAAFLPEEIQIQGARVCLSSPENRTDYKVWEQKDVDVILDQYQEAKWAISVPYAADGTLIRREGYDEILKSPELRNYFDEHVLGTEGYQRVTDMPEMKPYIEDVTADPEAYENYLYNQWLTRTYGQTRVQKIGSWLTSMQGVHTMLDATGIFFDPADAVNAALYLWEGDKKNAALSGICMIPMLGNLTGKGIGYLADLSKADALKGLKQLDTLEVFAKVDKLELDEWVEWSGELNKSLSEALEVNPHIRLTDAEGNLVELAAGQDLKVRVNLTDEAGDVTRYSQRVGGGITGNAIISDADRLKLDSWKYRPDDITYLKYKDIYDNPKYFNQSTGEINWPGMNGDPNVDGFLNGVYIKKDLSQGEIIDRFGNNKGSFFSKEGTSIEQRAMSPSSDFSTYNRYEVQTPIPVREGTIASWFDQPGGGIQYQLDPGFVDMIRSQLDIGEELIDGMIRLGYLKRL